jgi:succinate-acetate transporter protein
METRKHTDLGWDLFCWVLFTVLIVILVLAACALTWLIS